MKVGEIVEILISMRDDMPLDFKTDEAVCAACNILDVLPRCYEGSEIIAEIKRRF